MSTVREGKSVILFLLSLVLLGGCASLPRQELQDARQTHARAYAAGAHHLASQEYEQATQTLREAEELIHQGKHKQARKVLPLAESQAQRAILRALEEQARLEAMRRQEPGSPSRSPSTQPKARKRTAPQVSPTAPEVLLAPAPLAPPELPTSYVVIEGDTLWSISARSEIYVDALLWPLLYKANRDQIRDPRQIYTGQVLHIPRNTTETEREEARQRARSSDLVPLEIILRDISSIVR